MMRIEVNNYKWNARNMQMVSLGDFIAEMTVIGYNIDIPFDLASLLGLGSSDNALGSLQQESSE